MRFDQTWCLLRISGALSECQTLRFVSTVVYTTRPQLSEGGVTSSFS